MRFTRIYFLLVGFVMMFSVSPAYAIRWVGNGRKAVQYVQNGQETSEVLDLFEKRYLQKNPLGLGQ